MKLFSPEQKNKALDAAPEEIQDMLFSEAIADLLQGIAAKYTLTPNASIQLAALLFFYLTKLVDSREFVNELFRLAPERYFNQLRQELEDKLFSPYDTYLHQAGIAYRQLTKLEPKRIGELTEERPQTKPEPVPAEAVVLNVPEVKLSTGPELQPSLPANVVVISEQAQPAAQPVVAPIKRVGPVQPAPQSIAQAARVKVASGLLSPGLAVQANEPTPVRPEMKEVRFEVPTVISESASEITALTPEKEIPVPKPPVVPKTEVQGKEVIDLSSFSVKTQ